jgi:hypothetical protein
MTGGAMTVCAMTVCAMTDFFSRSGKASAVVAVTAAMFGAVPHRPKLTVG